MKLTPPIKWHGGKHYLADWIIEHMPPHTHYVEPFAGGLHVLLHKNPHGVSETVNDLDGDLTTFWRVLQCPKKFDGFSRVITAMPFSQVEFHYAANGGSDYEIDRAVRFFVRCRQSRQGMRKSFATMSRTRTRRGMNEQVSSWLTAIDGLPDVHERLRRVVIFNEPAISVIKRQDGPDTLFYCDPPYVHETRTVRNGYAHEMSEDEHCELLSALLAVKGKVLLSGYPNKLYDETLVGWRTADKIIDKKSSGAARKPQAVERLWMNYGPTNCGR